MSVGTCCEYRRWRGGNVLCRQEKKGIHEERVEEEHGIMTYNGGMFLLPHFHFQFKSANIFTILTSIPKHVCIFGDFFLTITRNISWVEFSVNKQIRLNCVLFIHGVQQSNSSWCTGQGAGQKIADFMNNYNWPVVHYALLVSRQFFQMGYSIIGEIP